MRYLLLLLAFLGSPAFAVLCSSQDPTITAGSTVDVRSFVPCTHATFPDLEVTEGAPIPGRYAPYYIRGCGTGADTPVWSGTLPAGVSINSSTGVISGTPTTAGETAASVTCTNALGAETHNFTFTVTGGTMKWNPGVYLFARQQESQYEPGDNAARAGHYDIIEGSSGVTGVGTYGAWASFESSQGVYDFSGLLADIAAAKARDLRYWLRLDDRNQENLPSYIWNGSCRLGTTNQWRSWNSTCRTHYKNMITALCAAVEDEPYFEGISVQKESALSSSASGQDGTYSLAGYAAGLQDIASHARTQCPTTNVVLNVNSFSGGSAEQTVEDLVDWGVLNDVGHGAPDTAPECVGNDPNPCTYETAANQNQMHYRIIANPQNRYAGQIPIAMGMEPSELGTGAVGEQPAYLPSTLHDYGVNYLGASHMLVVRNVVCPNTGAGSCGDVYGDSTKWLGTGDDGLTDGILWFYNNAAAWPNTDCPSAYSDGCITGNLSPGGIQFVAAGTADACNCNSITPGIPGAAAANQYAVVLTSHGNAATINNLTGWNGHTQVSNGRTTRIFRRVLTGSESNPTITADTAQTFLGAMAVFSGIDPVTPQDVTILHNTGTGITMTAPSATSATDGAMVLRLYAGTQGFDAAHINHSEGTVAFNHFTELGFDTAISMTYLKQTTAGPTGPATAVQDGTDGSWVAYTMILRPATE